MPYRPTKLFERLSDRNHGLRLFTDSPSARAIDFAARVFPIFEPKPKFADESPRMRPSPPPLVMADVGATWPWPLLGGVLLLWPLALIAGRSFEPGGPVRDRRHQPPRAPGVAPACETPPNAPDLAPVPAIQFPRSCSRWLYMRNAPTELSWSRLPATRASWQYMKCSP